jgi:hypothetical protein
MLETSMTLHVDSSTIRNQTVLAHVLDPVDLTTDAESDNGSQASTATATTDSAAISANGQRLAAMGVDHSDELNAIADAESFVRSLSASISKSGTSAAALHGSIDRSRAAALLVD